MQAHYSATSFPLLPFTFYHLPLVMTRDEIKTIADIVGGDDTYRHFVHRINKEFEMADEDRHAQVKVLFSGDRGFCVIGVSPAKMRAWEEIFKEENWVDPSFSINLDSHELMYMYIKPEWRNKGLGRQLIKKAFDYARQSNASNVYSYVSDRSDTSLNFYKKMNAQVIYDFSDDGLTTAFLKWDL